LRNPRGCSCNFPIEGRLQLPDKQGPPSPAHLDHDGEVLFSEEGEDVTSEVASEWSTVQLAQKVGKKNILKEKIASQIPQLKSHKKIAVLIAKILGTCCRGNMLDC